MDLIPVFLKKTKAKTKQNQNQKKNKGWRDGSAVKSTDCSSRGPEFNSQQPHGGSQPSVMRPDALFWCVWRQLQCTHMHKIHKHFLPQVVSAGYFVTRKTSHSSPQYPCHITRLFFLSQHAGSHWVDHVC